MRWKEQSQKNPPSPKKTQRGIEEKSARAHIKVKVRKRDVLKF
jgi:hypothetical protein